mmetsp:Transcript_47165/g.117685  ORF Transcript_47165/g.117685 Transcript_47165/m.117685 type:complete len:93 (+) Transcript_47165:626-904(+)
MARLSLSVSVSFPPLSLFASMCNSCIPSHSGRNSDIQTDRQTDRWRPCMCAACFWVSCVYDDMVVSLCLRVCVCECVCVPIHPSIHPSIQVC